MAEITPETVANKAEENPGEEINTTNEFAYLDRPEFTSERFKIEITGISQYTGVSDLKKMLKTKFQLEPAKIKKPGFRDTRAYICFRSLEDRDTALKCLTDYHWKGKVLSAKLANAAPDPLVRKRKQLESGGDFGKKFKDLPPEEACKLSATPYADIDYEKQLEMKQNDVRSILKKLGHELYKSNHLLQKYIQKQQRLHGGLPCELLNIRSASLRNGYRTKCEFTVGMDIEKQLPTVGFRTGTYANASTNVVSVESLLHIPDCMKKAAKLFETFVRNSKLPVFNQEFQSGVFKMLTARWSIATDELMLIIGIQNKELNAESYKQLKDDLIKFFSEGEGAEAKATSLFIKIVQRREPGEPSPTSEHLYGPMYIQEKLFDLTFRISPEAFFQVNTEGAEVLYSSAIELMQPTLETSVIDVCCGTGTIGLCFAKHCGQVLGLELIPEAVVDAKANAEINKIENVEFFEGRAEEILLSVVKKSKFKDVIAIVDPPRAGLHQKSVIQLRQYTNLNKLLYMSCKPEAALKNFIDLGRLPSKTLHNAPFVPVRAVAVDLFPHTKHCELLIYFERMSLESLASIGKEEIAAVPDSKTSEKMEVGSTESETKDSPTNTQPDPTSEDTAITQNDPMVNN